MNHSGVKMHVVINEKHARVERDDYPNPSSLQLELHDTTNGMEVENDGNLQLMIE